MYVTSQEYFRLNRCFHFSPFLELPKQHYLVGIGLLCFLLGMTAPYKVRTALLSGVTQRGAGSMFPPNSFSNSSFNLHLEYVRTLPWGRTCIETRSCSTHKTNVTYWILSPHSEIHKQLELGEVFEIIYSTTSAFYIRGRCGRHCGLVNSTHNHNPFLLLASTTETRTAKCLCLPLHLG